VRMDFAARLGAVVEQLARHSPRARVGIDGPDAAGKTTLADRLAAALAGPVLRVRADDYLRPADERYRRGDLSPEGYYRDLFDDAGILAATQDRVGIAVVDGVFLHRPTLVRAFDFTVYLRVSPEETLRRALLRDAPLFGSADVVEHRYRTRYLPGQALYRAEVDPERIAHVVIDNDDVSTPRILRWEPPGSPDE
jgi:uridine kinase